MIPVTTLDLALHVNIIIFTHILLGCSCYDHVEEMHLKVEFAAKMRSISGPRGAHTALVLDSSGSVGYDTWSHVRAIAEGLVSAVSGTGRFVSVVKYSNGATVVQTPTKDASSALQSVKAMSYEGGGTDTTSGLNLGEKMLPDTEDTGVRAVIHVTDGHPNNMDSAISSALRLILRGIKVFGVGVGGINLNNLQKMSSTGLALVVKDYDQLQRLVHEYLQGSTSESGGSSDEALGGQEVDLNVGVRHQSEGFANLLIKHPLDLNVHIHNLRVEGGLAIPKGSILSISDARLSPHFMPKSVPLKADIPADNMWTVPVKLQVRGSSKVIAGLPTHLTAKLKYPNGQSAFVSDSAKIDFPFHAYSGVFQPASHLNLLAIGFPGVGKTTFFKTVVSALSPEIQEVQNIGGGDGHVTKKITLYRFYDWIINQEVKINFWDTWGITKEAFKLDFLETLCASGVPDGYNMQEYAKSRTYVKMNSSSSAHMSAVMFFVRAVQSKDDELLTQMKSHIHQLTDLGYSSVVVITWLNELSDADGQQVVPTISRELQIPTNRVLPFKGYVHETEKDPEVDKNALEILESVMKHARMFEKTLQIQRKKEDTFVPQQGFQNQELLQSSVVAATTTFMAILASCLACMCHKIRQDTLLVSQHDAHHEDNSEIELPLGSSAVSDVSRGGSSSNQPHSFQSQSSSQQTDSAKQIPRAKQRPNAPSRASTDEQHGDGSEAIKQCANHERLLPSESPSSMEEDENHSGTESLQSGEYEALIDKHRGAKISEA